MRRRREIALVLIGAARGAGKGAMVGAALSVVTGAAVVVSLPGSVPVAGGILVIKAGTVGAFSATGSAIGAVCGGVAAHLRRRHEERELASLLAELEHVPAMA